MVVARWFIPHIIGCAAEIIKYCDVCQCVKTYKVQKCNETPHPILVPLKYGPILALIWIGSLKEIGTYRYIATAVEYTSMFVEVEQLIDSILY